MQNKKRIFDNTRAESMNVSVTNGNKPISIDTSPTGLIKHYSSNEVPKFDKRDNSKQKLNDFVNPIHLRSNLANTMNN